MSQDTSSTTSSTDDSGPVAIVKIGSLVDLRIFKQMLEKHQKGAESTKNTVESFGGDAHAFDRVILCIEDWKRQSAASFAQLAPKGNDAARGTPIGDALAKAETAERIALRDPSAETLEKQGGPQVGQRIYWPAEGVTTTIEQVHAIVSVDADAPTQFDVTSSDGWKGLVVAHYDGVERVKQWRVGGANYATPTVSDPLAAVLAPEALAANGGAPAAEDIPAPVAKRARGPRGEKRARDAARTEQELQREADRVQQEARDAGASPAEAAAAAADVLLGESDAQTGAANTSTKSRTQRERNQQTNGVRAAPKPSAKKK